MTNEKVMSMQCTHGYTVYEKRMYTCMPVLIMIYWLCTNVWISVKYIFIHSFIHSLHKGPVMRSFDVDWASHSSSLNVIKQCTKSFVWDQIVTSVVPFFIPHSIRYHVVSGRDISRGYSHGTLNDDYDEKRKTMNIMTMIVLCQWPWWLRLLLTSPWLRSGEVLNFGLKVRNSPRLTLRMGVYWV